MLNRFFASVVLILAVSYSGAVKIGYALSGGGARGFAHIGILKVLEEAGIRPDYISGTSMGALIGGLYSMGYNATQIESLFISTNWEKFLNDKWNRADLEIGRKRWAPYGNANFPLDEHWKPQLPQAVIIGNSVNLELFRLFSSVSDVTDFNQLPIPFTCVATDLVSGQMRIFAEGSLMQGIRASMSIPTIIQPFPLDNSLYLDGGISQNLPGKQVKEMGADCVIGFKVNSDLKSRENLNGIIQVLDQTINIGITNNINEQITYCGFIFEPDLSAYSAARFNDVQSIIRIGETYAREHLNELLASIPEISQTISDKDKSGLPQSSIKYDIHKFSVIGNQHIHSTKIREYTGLVMNNRYSTDDIVDGMTRAWNSQLFDIIYPVLVKSGEAYQLDIHVQERKRKYLAVNLTYDRDNEFSSSLVLSLHNYVMKNSQLMAEVKLGGINELNVDFVRNFGDAYGIYYRIFPYLEEKRIYFYQNHNKVTSARSLEYGVTTGVGLFASKLLAVEGYGFTSRTNLYREIAISDTLEKSVTISGIGVKAYHESLDDYMFPTIGIKASLKSSFSRNQLFSDVTVNRIKFEGIAFNPIWGKFSAIAGVHLGSHFKISDDSRFNPYYLGGLDAFAGYGFYEKSAPYYRLFQAGMTVSPLQNFFLSAKLQYLTYSASDNWFSDNKSVVGGVLEAGLKTFVIPIRLAAAVAGDSSPKYYIAIGYTGDIFHFSRR